MPLDALCLSGLVHELDEAVTGGKIDKIYQPGRDEVVLALRDRKSTRLNSSHRSLSRMPSSA